MSRRRPLMVAGAALVAAAALTILAVTTGGAPPGPESSARSSQTDDNGDVTLPVDPADLAASSVERAVERLSGPDVGQKALKKNLQALAAESDPRGARVVMALASAANGGRQHLTIAAVEALGDVAPPESKAQAASLARRKMDNADPQVVAAAARSFARLRGDAGIPEILGFIRNRWERRDGYELPTASAGAEALGLIGTPAATAALASELERVREPGWVMDYGSAVVNALDKCRTPEAGAALLNYAGELSTRKPGPDNPGGRKYYEDKIGEARAAAERTLPDSKGPISK